MDALFSKPRARLAYRIGIEGNKGYAVRFARHFFIQRSNKCCFIEGWNQPQVDAHTLGKRTLARRI